MEAEKPQSDSRVPISERFSQIRHLQTLRWAYLSTYLVSLGWFLSLYYSDKSDLRGDGVATLFISLFFSLLGIYVGIRVRQYTRIIQNDLTAIGTRVRGQGSIETWFAFATALFPVLFGVAVITGVLT